MIASVCLEIIASIIDFHLKFARGEEILTLSGRKIVIDMSLRALRIFVDARKVGRWRNVLEEILISETSKMG